MKELAKRFNLLTGFELTKIRKIVVSLHLGGIEYALKSTNPTNSREEDFPSNYPNMEFLEVVQEFSHKLIEEDRTGERGVNKVLGTLLPPAYKSRPKIKNWKTLHTFVTMLYKPVVKKVPQPLQTVESGGEVSGDSDDDMILSPRAMQPVRLRRVPRGARGGRGLVRGRGRSKGRMLTTLLPPNVTSAFSDSPDEQVDSPLVSVEPASSLISQEANSPLLSDTASPSVGSTGVQEVETDSENPDITNWMDDVVSLDSPVVLTSTVDLQRNKPRQSRKRPSYDTPSTMDDETPIAATRRSKRINLSTSESGRDPLELLETTEADSSSEL